MRRSLGTGFKFPPLLVVKETVIPDEAAANVFLRNIELRYGHLRNNEFLWEQPGTSRRVTQQNSDRIFAIAVFVKLGGAVGVLPPESEKPNRRVLQAQLRIFLVSTHASKRGLSSTADPLSRTSVESRDRTSPSFWPDSGAARADPLRPVATLD